MCYRCPIGKYQAKPSQWQCKTCPRGRIQPFAGRAKCLNKTKYFSLPVPAPAPAPAPEVAPLPTPATAPTPFFSKTRCIAACRDPVSMFGMNETYAAAKHFGCRVGCLLGHTDTAQRLVLFSGKTSSAGTRASAKMKQAPILAVRVKKVRVKNVYTPPTPTPGANADDDIVLAHRVDEARAAALLPVRAKHGLAAARKKATRSRQIQKAAVQQGAHKHASARRATAREHKCIVPNNCGQLSGTTLCNTTLSGCDVCDQCCFSFGTTQQRCDACVVAMCS